MNKEKIETVFNEVKKLHIPLFLAVIMISHLIIDVIYFKTWNQEAKQSDIITQLRQIYIIWSIIVAMLSYYNIRKFASIKYELDDNFKSIFDNSSTYYVGMIISIVFWSLVIQIAFTDALEFFPLMVICNCVFNVGYFILCIEEYYRLFYIPTRNLINLME